MTKTINNGKPAPLNFQKAEIPDYVEKSQPHNAQVEQYHRMGTPPTRRGMVNGRVSGLIPNPYHPSVNAELYLEINKAMGAPNVPLRPQQPMMPGQMPGMGQQAPAANMMPGGGSPNLGGPQLAQPKLPGMQQGGGAPGMGQVGQPQMQGQGQQGQPQIIGYTPDGQPIFGDPFHPAHQNFQQPEHQQAAQHQQAAGNPGAAQLHQEKAKDAMSPMDRAQEKFGQKPQGQQDPQGGRNPMEQDKGSASNQPHTPDPSGSRQGPMPGMHQAPAQGQNSMPQQQGQGHGNDKMAFIQALQQWLESQMSGSGAPAPTPGSHTQQMPQGNAEGTPKKGPVEKPTGPNAPWTNAGNQKTPVEERAQKSNIFKTFGW